MQSLIVLVACLTFVPAEAGPFAVRESFDVHYHRGGSRQTLDVFRPDVDDGVRRPVVLFVHGGTWMVGDKNFFGIYRGVGRGLARQGMVAVLINYRLSPLVRHPEHVRDVARAFAWTVRNIARYGGAPDRIILAGHSAGAHLVSLLVTDPKYLREPALKLDRADEAIRGVVSISGVYRIPSPSEFARMAGRIIDYHVGPADSSRVARVVNPTLKAASAAFNPFYLVFGFDQRVRKGASPISHVRRGLPPFLLMTAEYEVPGLWQMAEDFAGELRRCEVPVAHQEIEGCSHRTIVKLLHRESDTTRELLKFIRQHAGKPTGKST